MELNTAIWGTQNEWSLDTDTFSATNSPYAAYTGKYKYLKDYRDNNIFDFGTEIDNTILYCGQAAEVSPLGGAAAFYYNENFEGTPEPYIQRNEEVSTFLASIGNSQTAHTGAAASIAANALTTVLYYKGAVNGGANTRWVIDGDEYITGDDDWYNVANMNAPIVDFDPKCLFGVIYVVAGNDNDGITTMTLHQLETGNYSNYKIYKAFMRAATVSAVSGVPPYTTTFNEIYSSTINPNKKGLGIIDFTPWKVEGKNYVNYIQNGRAINSYPSIPLFGFDLGVGYLYHYSKYGFSWRSYHFVSNNAERDWANDFSFAPIFYGAKYATFTDVYANKSTNYTDVSFIGYMENTAENRENIRKMAACYGIYFTEYNYSDDSTLFDSDDRYTNEHMCLGLLHSGVGYGDYTRGTGNIDNPAYSWTSSHQSGYKQPVLNPIERPDRICVYSIYEPQDGYNNNGEAVLWPSELESFKEDKGRWDIELKHPIDPYGKWTYIIGQNCIKVNGQIFRIDETEIYTDANQQYIKAHANHISFDLKDRFIGDATFTVNGGTAYMEQVYIESTRLFPTQQPTPYEYTFEIVSDITGELTGDIHDQTIIGAFYGDDNSFANRYGGELYRDNFHISINSTMENAPAAPAFQLRYGTDLTKISYKIDFSEWITELLCEDNFGNILGVSYVGSEWIIHHHKTKRLHFTYSPDTPDPGACLTKDMYNYWQTVNTPKVSIDVAVANLKNDPKYKGFVDLQNLDVGYTGNVYFEQFGIDINLKIVSIRRNELTGEAIQIVLGNSQGSFVKSPVMSQTIVPNSSVSAIQAQTLQDMQTEIETVKLKSMRTWGGIKAYKWSDVKSYKWEEIKNGNADE